MPAALATTADPDDLDPIVILDDEPAGPSVAALGYLAGHGVGPATATDFRIDSVTDASLARLLSRTQRRQLRPGGLWLPTYDPREPEHIVGLVRMIRAQNVHRFLTAPAGLACAPGVADAPRVVLCDNPLLGLRLHELGVGGVAVVESPAVLPPLTPWLAAREVVAITTAKSGHLPLPQAVRPVGSARLIGGLERAPAEVLALLGLDPAQVRPDVPPPPPITPHLLRDLLAFAQERVAAGEAAAALAIVGADVPDLVRAYGVGFLPADYRQALPAAAQRAFHGHRLGNALVFPAYDVRGVVADLLVWRVAGPHVAGLFPEPRGLLAPAVAQGHEAIVVTDHLPGLVRLFQEGWRDALLLRGVVDAERNAERLAAAGVRRVELRVRRDAEGFAAVLGAVGITVIGSCGEPPVLPAATRDHTQAAPALPSTLPLTPASSPPPAVVPPAAPPGPAALVFVEEEHDGRVAIFQAGPVRYAVTMRDDGLTQRRVVIRAHGKSCTHDLDLAVPAARERIEGGAARQVGLPAATIQAHLVGLLAGVQAREDARERGPVVTVADGDRPAAEAFLSAPDLLDRVADNDLAALGWVGEGQAKRTLYLAAISRLLPQPVWALYQAGSGAAPWQGVGCVAALAPPEAVSIFHRLTDAALAQADRASLLHRLLIVDQAEALRPEAALALRVLRERGGVGWPQVGSGAGGTGVEAGRAGRSEARGPVAVLAAAAGEIDHRCRGCFLRVTMDESSEQTARILAEQRHHLAAGNVGARAQAAIIARHHAAQRLLERLPVAVPFADRIVFPASRVRHRDEQRWFLGLVAACALLHQRQRPRVDGAVVASEADFATVQSCTAGFLGQESNGINAASRRLLDAITAHRPDTFTLADLAALLPDWTRWSFRAALDDLAAFGHVDASHRVNPGRGHLRRYRLVTTAAAATPPGIHLRAAGNAAEPDGTDAEMVWSKVAESGGDRPAILCGVAV